MLLEGGKAAPSLNRLPFIGAWLRAWLSPPLSACCLEVRAQDRGHSLFQPLPSLLEGQAAITASSLREKEELLFKPTFPQDPTHLLVDIPPCLPTANIPVVTLQVWQNSTIEGFFLLSPTSLRLPRPLSDSVAAACPVLTQLTKATGETLSSYLLSLEECAVQTFGEDSS